MSEMKTLSKGETALSELIRRELGSQGNRGLLARIPDFRADADLPERLLALLGELDAAEKRGASR